VLPGGWGALPGARCTPDTSCVAPFLFFFVRLRFFFLFAFVSAVRAHGGHTGPVTDIGIVPEGACLC
jgi:hypothetical protein